MKKIVGIICVLLIILPIASSSFSAQIPINNEQQNRLDISDLEITDISLSDSTLLCQFFGGQNISINVSIRNNGNVDYSGSFIIELFTNQVSYLTQHSFTQTIGAGDSITLCFSNVHIAVELGQHTLDAYFSGDIHSRYYRVFSSTLTGANPYEKLIYPYLMKYRKAVSPEIEEYATVYLKTFDLQSNKYVRRPLNTISYQDVNLLKNEITQVAQFPLSNDKRIEKQFEILHKWNILPDEVAYDEFVNVLEQLKQRYTDEYSSNQFPLHSGMLPDIVTGPSVWSLLSSWRIYYPFHLLLSNLMHPLYMQRLDGLTVELENILFNSSLNGWVYVMTMLDACSSSSTLGLISGTVLSGNNVFFSPFFSLQFGSFGIIIEVVGMKDINPVMLCSMVISASLFGSVLYLNSD